MNFDQTIPGRVTKGKGLAVFLMGIQCGKPVENFVCLLLFMWYTDIQQAYF